MSRYNDPPMREPEPESRHEHGHEHGHDYGHEHGRAHDPSHHLGPHLAPATAQPYVPANAAELGGFVRHRWWLALLIGILAAVLAYGGTLLVPTRYAATVTIVVQIPGTSADTEALVRTVEALTTSSVVLGDIAFNSQTDLSPSAVEDRMEIDRPAGSAVIEVTVTDTSRARARQIAREIVPVLKRRIGESSSDIESGAQIAVDSFGNGPEVEVVNLPVIQIVAVGGIAGTGLGVLLVLYLAGRRRRRAYRPIYAEHG
jgi:receptor protein-tyrosine kinase